jgi:hypothetical protein
MEQLVWIGKGLQVTEFPNRHVGVRKESDPRGPVLLLDPESFNEFLRSAFNGAFDSLYYD